MSEFSPIFIFGVARSGTNFLARSLRTHPEVMVALDPLMPLFKAWRNLIAEPIAKVWNYSFDPQCPFQDFYFDPVGVKFLDAMISAPCSLSVDLNLHLKNSICERASLEDPKLGNALEKLRGNTVEQIFASTLDVIASYAKFEDKNHLTWVGLKEVWVAEFVNSLAQAFPTGKFIVIHRDPRAVIASLMALSHQDPSQAAHIISYMRHWRKQVSVVHYLSTNSAISNRLLSVRYEDIVTEPVTWLDKIGQFLHLEDSFYLLRGIHTSEWRGNSSFGVNVGINSNAAERWRDCLPLAIQATVEFHCAPEMAMLGYICNSIKKDVQLNMIWDTIMDADRNPGKWRSDSGDVEADFAWELRRWSLLRDRSKDIEEIRRCFLFESIYEELLQVSSGDLFPNWEVMA
jgi:hypothetical protein